MIREYKIEDIPKMVEIWNSVVLEGNAFPQRECLTLEGGKEFFASQTYCAVAECDGDVLGLYILHPNNIGRCGHISNASYAVAPGFRDRHIGEALVRDCISAAEKNGFGILQFNAVVASNKRARHLYEKLGFQSLGTIKNGFMLDDGTFEDICPYYIEVKNRA